MKLTFLVFCVLSGAVLAQVSPQAVPAPHRPRIVNSQGSTTAESLPENYILSLTASEKDKVTREISMVVGSPVFGTTVPDLSFTGSISPLDDGTFLVRYSLESSVAVPAGGDSVQYKNISVSTAVRLRPGETIQVYKSELRSYQLSLTRLADQKKSK
jgi:hypothetical protein